MYDRLCPDGHEMIDCWEPVNVGEVICKECSKPTERAWLTKPGNIIQDSIEGGIWIRHGLCNEDGTPRKYYSKSEIQKEADRRGLVNRVEHTVDPRTGGDKSRHTTRWY
jgi:hypothetical protein